MASADPMHMTQPMSLAWQTGEEVPDPLGHKVEEPIIVGTGGGGRNGRLVRRGGDLVEREGRREMTANPSRRLVGRDLSKEGGGGDVVRSACFRANWGAGLGESTKPRMKKRWSEGFGLCTGKNLGRRTYRRVWLDEGEARRDLISRKKNATGLSIFLPTVPAAGVS